ncbi:MAG: hypothetical protein JWM18_714 [Chloroflexi bacterium]|jgi:hypothetical protein|nr:hypothetical protein [Chloroflexota bacterium]
MLPLVDVETVIIVGFDGSAASRRALRTAALGLHRRPGRIEVVFVSPAEVPGQCRRIPWPGPNPW